MIAKVFVSTGDSTEIAPGPGGPGGTWESVGMIDSSRERDLWKWSRRDRAQGRWCGSDSVMASEMRRVLDRLGR